MLTSQLVPGTRRILKFICNVYQFRQCTFKITTFTLAPLTESHGDFKQADFVF